MSEIIKYGKPDVGVDDGLDKGNLKICIAVTSQAKSLAPKKDGVLTNSLMWVVGTTKGAKNGGFNSDPGVKAAKILDIKPEKFQGFVGSALDYATYQEFGTRYMAPQPYLRPAVAIVVKGQDAAKVLAKIQLEEMKGALKKGVKRVRF